MHTCRVYTKDCVDPTHIGRDISSCCYLRMLSYHHHHHHWYLWIYPFFVSFSWHQIDSYLEHSNGDTFACAFDALHEPFRNIWLVPLCLVHATRNNKRGENYSTTTKLGIHHTLFWVGAEGGFYFFGASGGGLRVGTGFDTEGGYRGGTVLKKNSKWP